MRFSINKDFFLKSLNIVSKMVPIKSFNASLVNVKLVLDKKGLNLIGSNEKNAVHTFIPFSDKEEKKILDYKEGSVLINGKLLNEIIRKLPDGNFSLELLDNSVVEISSTSTSFKLNLIQNSDEYPLYNFNEEGLKFNISTSDFINLIEETSFAAANNENRLALVAINLKAKKKELTALALDGYRYAEKKIKISEDIEFNVNIPAKVINEIIRIFDNTEKLNIIVNDKKIFFKFDNTTIFSNLLNEDFPNVEKIIPSDFKSFLEIKVQAILCAIDRMCILNNEKKIIKLIANNDEVKLFSVGGEIGNSSETIEKTSFKFNGEKIEILFNANFVLDAIKALKNKSVVENVLFKFVSNIKPVVIESNEKPGSIQLIVPTKY